ncbi:MAG: hypothetical protein IT365_09510 [Candidatus Hydrogenedentes bacterium]|nr:hypothetical protein [Candidatus Hydrogenedentota bacterium]
MMGDPNAKSSLKAVGSFTIAYLLLAILAALLRGNQEFIFYIVVMVLLVGMVMVVHRRVCLSQGALWALSIWGLAHMMGGLVPVPAGWPINGEIRVLYSLWLIPEHLKYDHIVHAYGFGTTTWVCWQGLRSVLRGYGAPVVPTFGLMVLSAAGGLGFGALNEVVEFAATLLVPETNVGGYINTGWDLVSNSVGATLVALLIYFLDRPGESGSK